MLYNKLGRSAKLSLTLFLWFASDFFSVVLVKNRSALEIGHSGQYLLSIRDNAIVLHWRTGAIAHHWPRKSVLKLSIDPEREGHLILQATR